MVLSAKKLFLIDGLGALLSAFLLSVVLVQFRNYFEMPIPILYFLASIACALALYSISCYFFVKQKTLIYLKVIGIANIIYSLLTIGFVLFLIKKLNPLDWIYFIAELIIILFLIRLELKTVAKLDKIDQIKNKSVK